MRTSFRLRTIRGRLLAAIVALSVMLTVIAGVGLLGADAVTTANALLYRNDVAPMPKLKQLSDVFSAGIDGNVRKRQVGQISREDLLVVLREAQNDLDRLWQEIEPTMLSERSRAMAAELEPYLDSARQLLVDLADMAERDDRSLLDLTANFRMPAVIDPVVQRLSDLATQKTRVIVAKQERIEDTGRTLVAIELALALLALAVCAGVGRVAVINVGRPLSRITRAMRRLAGGDLGVKIPYMSQRDEIGQAARALDVFKRNARDLAIARDQAEAATRAKSSFLAMMSHEIRSPMNGVMAMAEMLEQTRLTEDQRSMSSVIRNSAASLLTIINDILDFSKIEAGKLDLEHVPFSLTEIVETAAELIAVRADEKMLDLVVDLDPEIPDGLVGDPTRLRQVLLNLVGNAVKFTEAGSIRIEVGLVAPDGRQRLRCAVHDTGIGMTDAQRRKLFHPFAQADSSTSRRFGGTGLGLSISQRLVEMMDGTIGVDSAAGHGSTFWFELPLRLQPDAAKLRPAHEIGEAQVVAVGFSGAERIVLAQQLAAASVGNVQWLDEAPDPAALQHTTIVLVRATPGSARGLDCAATLAPRAMVVLVAPRSLVSTLDAALRQGVFAALTTPLRRQRLWRVLAAALGKAALDEGVPGDANQSWQPPSIEAASEAGVLVLVAEDNPTNQQVIARLLSQSGFAHEIVADGARALARWRTADRSHRGDGGIGLLLTDFHMPEMDGLQLTAAIRAEEAAHPTLGRLPIVALTADALPETAQLCRAAGMDGYLTKPIDTAALRELLDATLPGAHALRVPSSGAAALPPALPDIDPRIFDVAYFVATFGGLTEEARVFLRGFLADLPRMVGDVVRATTEGQLSAARDAAHALKGAAWSSGALRLGQIASDVVEFCDSGNQEMATLLAGLLPETHLELEAATVQLFE